MPDRPFGPPPTPTRRPKRGGCRILKTRRTQPRRPAPRLPLPRPPAPRRPGVRRPETRRRLPPSGEPSHAQPRPALQSSSGHGLPVNHPRPATRPGTRPSTPPTPAPQGPAPTAPVGGPPSLEVPPLEPAPLDSPIDEALQRWLDEEVEALQRLAHTLRFKGDYVAAQLMEREIRWLKRQTAAVCQTLSP